jgi:hypothetical protein
MTKQYYGTKLVTAWPELGPEGEGYGVIYADGYQSWSPKKPFEDAYQPLDALSFGHAIAAMQDGHAVTRAGWNGKGMFIYIVSGHLHQVTEDELFLGGFGDTIPAHPYIMMKTAQGYIVPWLASQADMLANDWQIYEPT